MWKLYGYCASTWSRQKSNSQLRILCTSRQRVTKGKRIGLLTSVLCLPFVVGITYLALRHSYSTTIGRWEERGGEKVCATKGLCCKRAAYVLGGRVGVGARLGGVTLDVRSLSLLLLPPPRATTGFAPTKRLAHTPLAQQRAPHREEVLNIVLSLGFSCQHPSADSSICFGYNLLS